VRGGAKGGIGAPRDCYEQKPHARKLERCPNRSWALCYKYGPIKFNVNTDFEPVTKCADFIDLKRRPLSSKMLILNAAQSTVTTRGMGILGDFCGQT
jgi:hypothetical protein